MSEEGDGDVGYGTDCKRVHEGSDAHSSAKDPSEGEDGCFHRSANGLIDRPRAARPVISPSLGPGPHARRRCQSPVATPLQTIAPVSAAMRSARASGVGSRSEVPS